MQTLSYAQGHFTLLFMEKITAVILSEAMGRFLDELIKMFLIQEEGFGYIICY